MNRRFFVYILTNGPRGVLYVGVTNDLIRRLSEHKAKLVPGFTKAYGVWRHAARLIRGIFLYSGSSSTRSGAQALAASMENRAG
jgi:predicted HAD superfamily phosphohydrolase